MNQRSVQVCQPNQLMLHILQLWSLGCDSRKNSASSDDENNNERKSSKSQSLLQQGRQLVRQQSGGGGQGRNSMEKNCSKNGLRFHFGCVTCLFIQIYKKILCRLSLVKIQ